MKGQYILIIFLEENSKITIGKLGRISFPKGYYAYVGSALNSLEKRIERHRQKEKKIRWHIDYFLKKGRIVDVKVFESNNKSDECRIAAEINKKSVTEIKGFGSSDCKCKSHLFFFGKTLPKDLIF